mmetsp:Transcript_35512/g.46721  ORF Transcript_35512/g.46721 Transcript_35512/m.46721 type:complete len:91 (-) Transcript_35512:914-1186(-)|eukprot:CAMPEP_0185594438 /NCGR_PEP_ID=MMETSP0434-20130131/74879_1 /TAXON_ID=626734 ORGANISM="Favella taraikaensis, Strain Fe Narragansett Bay" /NCGR_SAMPLE_ID=MMETSP0434 /ASSEMBLY_ACC=CAM_ASM_000379 /LENGTH=90 /DNA_ID=CAMNT_0028221765 /DNA_START=1770 /DNA_END=2042 /DNA_ORIENTATION=-
MTVHVRDTGQGIKPEDMERLFHRFGKLEDTKELNLDGIGLGLTICEAIVRANEGKIQILSDGLYQGTLVIFTMKMETVAHDELSVVERSH